jgi:hypothetical protein
MELTTKNWAGLRYAGTVGRRALMEIVLSPDQAVKAVAASAALAVNRASPS